MDEKKEVKIPTLTLNPNETEVAAAQAVQEQVNAVAEEVKEEVPAEKLGLDSLTPEEQAAVMEFVDKIDVLNTEQILNYGSNAQKNIADFSESALETVKTKDLGQVGEMLGNLVVELKGQHITQGYCHTSLLQLLIGTEGLRTDKAVDTILCRIGNG
jgi:uncharacterized protein YaaN involved in tellurite resistance